MDTLQQTPSWLDGLHRETSGGQDSGMWWREIARLISVQELASPRTVEIHAAMSWVRLTLESTGAVDAWAAYLRGQLAEWDADTDRRGRPHGVEVAGRRPGRSIWVYLAETRYLGWDVTVRVIHPIPADLAGRDTSWAPSWPVDLPQPQPARRDISWGI